MNYRQGAELWKRQQEHLNWGDVCNIRDKLASAAVRPGGKRRMGE